MMPGRRVVSGLSVFICECDCQSGGCGHAKASWVWAEEQGAVAAVISRPDHPSECLSREVCIPCNFFISPGCFT